MVGSLFSAQKAAIKIITKLIMHSCLSYTVLLLRSEIRRISPIPVHRTTSSGQKVIFETDVSLSSVQEPKLEEIVEV